MTVDATRQSAPQGRARGVLRKTGRVIGLCVAGAAIAYCAAASFMYFNQRSFVFEPSGELEMPEVKGLQNVRVETIAMADGTDVTVWSANVHPRTPAVLYFHGNSRSLSARHKRFKQILDSGYGLYAPTYRGFAGSEGSPSETAIIADALEHYDRLAATGAQVILHGESLGTGVATAVAAQRPDARLLVLEAPYTALLDIASQQYPWLPVAALMKDPMLTRERIKNIHSPVLILHGTADRIVPVEHGRRLYELAPEPKRLRIVDGVGHKDLWKNGLWETVRGTYCALDESKRVC
jgi:hypothetical protein